MDDKELEKKLMESANEVQIRGFSSRWKEIKKKMSPPKKSRKRMLKYITALATTCCMIALAVVLPIVLRPKKEVLYYFPNNIPFQSATQEQFFLELTSVDFQTVDLSSLPIDEYFIGKSADQVVRGGVVAYNNLDGLNEYVFIITFYSPDVKFEEGTFSALTNTVTIDNTEIAYKTTEEDLYESRAFFVYSEVSYIVEYTSLNDDFPDFLSNLMN